MTLDIQKKNQYQAELFFNRLKKKYRELKKWARKNDLTCYRLYDRDIPEIPLSVDLYEFLPDSVHNAEEACSFIKTQNDRIAQNDISAEKDRTSRLYAVLYLYERPYEKSLEEEAEWYALMAVQTADVFGIQKERIITKERKMQKGLSQYEKNTESAQCTGLVYEQGQIFFVNLTEYLDTGLFFDHRPLRATIRNISDNKRVLNLFCYTGSFSVYAAQGNADFIESVDLSNTYLKRAAENMKANGFCNEKKYVFTKADAIAWLSEKAKYSSYEQKFDIIILDPPTFSNSKSAVNMLDINRDWPALVEDCVNLLKPNGTLYFSTNSTRLKFDQKLLPKNTDCAELTQSTIPKDFEDTKCHRVWKITLY